MEDPLVPMAVSDTLISRFREATSLIESTEGMIRVISHYDGDGICSAGIVSVSLFRFDKRFHSSTMSVMTSRDIDGLDGAGNLLIVCDMGSSMAREISSRAMEAGFRCILLDHHLPDGRGDPYSISDGRGILEINPRFHGINGSTGCCGSTLAYLMSLALSPKNIDLGVFALAGAIADRQNVPSFSELNKNIADHLVSRQMVRVIKGLPLQGRNMEESLIMSNDPFITDLSGNPMKVTSILNTLGVDPQSTMMDMEKEKLKLLQSYLYVHMLGSGADPGAVHELFREGVYSREWGDVQSLAFDIDSCGRISETGTGIELIFGSRKARERASEVRRAYRSRVQTEVRKIAQKGPRRLEYIDVLDVEEDKMGGILAGIAHNYILSHSRPVLALSTDDESVKVSARGNRGLCKRGLNLGRIMSEVSKELGGSGGGHDVAAGATVPAGAIEDFLRKCDSMVGEQIGSRE
ncbi:MAG: DHH family phosphoesterase [Candidatus Thermoplasmatota archaeon]|nr:DHH family phosphoesterase [Candidatus Thermoplasmatota archaeon]